MVVFRTNSPKFGAYQQRPVEHVTSGEASFCIFCLLFSTQKLRLGIALQAQPQKWETKAQSNTSANSIHGLVVSTSDI